ncbi:MAG: 50S ribosomal protein L18 [Defluviitaleaceae bacterium]|nr:50S ribosomal protein L18 [Defluviitaleaceae bacterium]
MIKKPSRNSTRQKRHYRLRRNISGTNAKPRLNVFRSNKHIYAQVIDDVEGSTIVAASTKEKTIGEGLKSTADVEAAKAVGLALGKRAIQQGIETVVFDRGGYLYHGRVAALAEGAREAGLKF